MKLRFVRLNFVDVKEKSCVKYSLCFFVDLVMLHTNPMRRIVLSPSARLLLPCLLHYFNHGSIFGKIKQTVYFLIFCKVCFVTFLL
jgi:hypothetical protein